MFNLFDILQAQGGTGAPGLGHQFGLTPDQTRKAMEALLPAFTLGLQRNAYQDPMGFTQLFGFVIPPGAKPSQPGAPQVDEIVRRLFGSPHLSQAVVQQAAAFSGVASPVLRQMLPVLAGMVVAGIVHVVLNQPPAAAPPPASNPAPNPFGFPAASFWSDLMTAHVAGRAGAPAAAPAPVRSPAKVPERPRPAEKPAPEVPYEVVQQLFQTGIETQQEHLRAMQGLFDAFWQGRDGTPARPRRA